MFQVFGTALSLFGALPGFDLEALITWAGVLGVALIIFAETGLLIGFFLPGDSLLFTAGFLIQVGILNANVNLFFLLMFVAAIIGDSTGYSFGRRVGRRIFAKPDARLFRQEHLRRAEDFYEKHGGITIILARFMPVIRTFAPIVAGTAKMRYATFVSFNVIGGLLWTGAMTYGGYWLGAWFSSMGLDVDQVILPIVAIIILLSIAPPIIQILKEPSQRQGIWRATKREVRILLGKEKR